MPKISIYRAYSSLNISTPFIVTPTGEHVGNLKRIGAIWKFKAIGYDAHGDVEPGGGPLTERHNLIIDSACAHALNAAMRSALL